MDLVFLLVASSLYLLLIIQLRDNFWFSAFLSVGLSILAALVFLNTVIVCNQSSISLPLYDNKLIKT